MKVLNYTGLQNLWTNIKNYITAHTPTKTSDLTNDSNFVDTSNSAVASGITSAKVTDYDTHIADTDIHVTTADKTKWNNQTYVFRYSSTALTPSSTNSNTLLDNTDNLKVGDKVIDSSGVLFSITAIDAQNSTFTIGTVLIDLALDANVVHTSGNETVGGEKTFDAGQINVKSTIQEMGVIPQTSTLQYMPFMDKNNVIHGLVGLWDYDNGASEIQLNISDIFKNGVKDKTGTLDTSFFSFGFLSTGVKFTTFGGQLNNSLIPLVNSTYDVGSSSYKWKSVYGTNYYYGSNNVEFSQKFVTTDTNQTISGSKTFTDYSFASSGYGFIGQGNRTSYILPEFTGGYSGLSIVTPDFNKSVKIGTWITDENTGKKVLNTTAGYLQFSTGNFNNISTVGITPVGAVNSNLGTKSNKWKTFNDLEPSSLSLPSGNVSDVIDISSYITALDGTNNTYIAPANGWISITVIGTAIAIVSSSWSDSRLRASSGNVRMLYPVLKNETLTISIVATTLAYARFIPCQGNV